jgi:hypothetical protein
MTLDEEDVTAIAAAVVRMLRGGAVSPASPPPARLSKAELAVALHRTPATVDRWVRDGMPCDDMGSYKLFDLAACRAWVAARPRVERPQLARAVAPPVSLSNGKTSPSPVLT